MDHKEFNEAIIASEHESMFELTKSLYLMCDLFWKHIELSHFSYSKEWYDDTRRKILDRWFFTIDETERFIELLAIFNTIFLSNDYIKNYLLKKHNVKIPGTPIKE